MNLRHEKFLVGTDVTMFLGALFYRPGIIEVAGIAWYPGYGFFTIIDSTKIEFVNFISDFYM